MRKSWVFSHVVFLILILTLAAEPAVKAGSLLWSDTRRSMYLEPHGTSTQSSSDSKLVDTLSDGSRTKNLTFDRLNKQFTWEARDAFGFDTHGGKAIPIHDVDGDGKNEVIIANATHESSFVRVFRNQTTVADLYYTGRFNEVSVGDSDNDGLNEILIATSSWQVFIYGSDYMLEDTIPVMGSNIGGVTTGDSDGDAKNEVLIADNTYGFVRIFKHNGSSYIETISLKFGLAWDVKVGYLVHGVTTGPGNSLVVQGAGTAKVFLYYSGAYHEKANVETDASKRPSSEANIVIQDATNEGENKLVAGKKVYRPLGVGGLQLAGSLSVLDPASQIESIAVGYIGGIGNIIALGTSVSFEIHWWDGNSFRPIYEEYEFSSNRYGSEGVGIGDIDNDGDVEILAHRIGSGRYLIYELRASYHEEAVYLKIPRNAVIESAHINLTGRRSQDVVVENQGTMLMGYPIIAGLEQKFTLREDVDLAAVELHLESVPYSTSYAEVELRPLLERANTSEKVDEERWYRAYFPSISELKAGEEYSFYLRLFGQSNIIWWGTWRIGYHFRLFEAGFPTNPSLDVAETSHSKEWSYVGEFNESVSPQSADLNASLINSYLATAASDPEGNKVVRLLFRSDSAGELEISHIRVFYDVDTTSPTTIDNYDGLWHNSDFVVTLNAQDDSSGVDETYYLVNDGPIKRVSVDGQPQITTEDSENKLEYWSVDNAGNEELPPHVLSEIKLDKTAPTANAGANQTVNEDTLVTFDASASTDANSIATYAWAFTDTTPQTLTGKKPTYTFADPGTYTITLRVTDPAGNTAIDPLTVTVLDVTKPAASAGSDQTINEDISITFDGSASSDNVGITSYTWTFTDGTTKTLTGEKPAHTFNTPGVYTVILNVTDAADNWSTDTVVITVLDTTKPTANAGSDQTINVGAIVTFDASASSDNVGIVSYEWDFGDETTGTGKTATHSYSKEGNYTVTLTVKDAARNIGYHSIAVAVLSLPTTTTTPNTWMIVGGVIAIVGMAIGATLLLRRRK